MDSARTSIDRANPHFGSDNYAGACPEVWDALRELGRDHCPAYGEDEFTEKAREAIRKFFDLDCEVFFVFTGTAANALALASACQPYHSVICAPTAHRETDECGAPSFFANGGKILVTADADVGITGKVTSAEVARIRALRRDVHYPKPRVVSVTQATELGTVYSLQELQVLYREAHEVLRDPNGELISDPLIVHMDGARFLNAVAFLDVSPKELIAPAGADHKLDVLCFGGTKTGITLSEAVVFFNREIAEDFARRCKQAGQLASKMRFLAIPWLAMLENATWLKYARNANARAAELAGLVGRLPGVRLPFERQANAVFVELPAGVAPRLREAWRFYTDFGPDCARFMCAWDTGSDDVKALAADIERLINRS